MTVSWEIITFLTEISTTNSLSVKMMTALKDQKATLRLSVEAAVEVWRIKEMAQDLPDYQCSWLNIYLVQG